MMVDPQLARSGLMLLLVVIPMFAESRLSRRNEARLREQGAQEPAGDTYRVMSLAYPLAFLAIIGEGAMGAPVAGTWFLTGLTLFGASKILKYSAIRALSTRWCFKVLVPPQSVIVRSGPYCWLRHPNYVAVIGEIVATAIAMQAPVTGSVAVVGYAVLLVRRVQIESAALRG